LAGCAARSAAELVRRGPERALAVLATADEDIDTPRVGEGAPIRRDGGREARHTKDGSIGVLIARFFGQGRRLAVFSTCSEAGGTILSMSCKCSSYCRRVRKRAKNTHVAGANCCSSYKNAFTKCGKCGKRCRCRRCRGDRDEIGDEIFLEA
jgi:hypothetical protein